MIFGNISDMSDSLMLAPEPSKKVLMYLANTNFNSIPDGRYPIQGDDIYVTIKETVTKDKNEAKPEVHRRYVDVQYIIVGIEKIGYARDNGKNDIYADMLKEKDLLLYKDLENESELILVPGCFAVFFPEDAHRAACRYKDITKIRKAVVKINIELFKADKQLQR